MKTDVEWALLSPEGTYHKLCEPNFFVGREDDMDLTLKSRSVDMQHAVISVNAENREYKLHDLGTLNGTFVNEVRVRQQPVNLKLRDNIRFGYGDKYLSRRVKVVVSSEKSPRDLSFVKLGLPVVILDKTDKKVVSFLLKPEEAVITPAAERKLSIQSSTQSHQTNSDEDDQRSGTPDQEIFNMYHGVHPPHSPQSQFHPYPHYPYMAPMYHHPPPVMCHCPSCTGHRSPVHSPHGGAPGGFVHHQMGPHASWSHASPMAFQVRPRLQRPLSVPGEKFEMKVKGSPLYGQPPWWGWGSSDDEIYNYPNTATIMEGDSHAEQQALSLKKKKLTKKDALEMAQRRHNIGTFSVLSESKARIVTTRTSKTTYDPERERAMKEREEFVVFQKKSALPSPGYSDQLSPVFENSTSRDWEKPISHSENVERDSSLAECDSSLENSPDDCNEGHSRPGSYEIPFIPDYDEIPERPVSQKSEKGKIGVQDNSQKSALDKQNRVTRKKPVNKIKKRTTASDASARNGKTSSGSRKHSSDTSESECEPSSHPSRRLGVVTRGTPSSSRVFGLTEVSMQREGYGDSRESLSPAPLPSWVQQWANSVDLRDHQPVEVLGSSSAAEDSTNSSSVMSSSSHIPVPVQPDDSENKCKPDKAVSSPVLNSRPRSASSRTNSPSLMRSQSLSSSPKTTLSPRVSRSKTMSAAIDRRSYPTGTGSKSDRKATESARRRGLGSGTSDDSDVESSDTSQTRQTKDSRRKSDESDRKGVQLIPEKEGKRPLSAPRPNKTAMLRAHSSREAIKNSSVKNKTPSTAKSRTAKSSSSSDTGNGGGIAANHTSDSSPSARVWTPSAKSSTKSSTGDDNVEVGEISSECVGDDVTQEVVDDVFSSGPVRSLPESLQMKRDDPVNKTFVLDEGNGDSSVSSPEDTSMQAWVNKASNSENLLECNDTSGNKTTPASPPSSEAAELKLESTNTLGVSLRSKLIPFAPFRDTQPYTPPVSDHPFEPPSDSADYMSGGSHSSTGEGRSVSPESVVSAAPAASPSPPLTPSSAAKKMFDFKGGATSSQSRRQWGVTDKPVEDLMLSSIHAFSVELRLASESVLSKVKTLYDGSEEELNGTGSRSRNNSDTKQESQSAIPDWKSSHAEIAGIFRNLRKVELRLRTMEQALSIMCVAAQREPNQERKLSMVETSSLGSGQKWREFKMRARRNSWAVEHRNQFPVPPAESDEEDEDTP